MVDLRMALTLEVGWVLLCERQSDNYPAARSRSEFASLAQGDMRWIRDAVAYHLRTINRRK